MQYKGILGLILGPIAETEFRQSVILAKGPLLGYILGSPISLTLFALTLLFIASAIFIEVRRIRSDREATSSESACHRPRPLPATIQLQPKKEDKPS